MYPAGTPHPAVDTCWSLAPPLGIESRCELAPQRVIIRVSINQSTNSSKACFISISPFSCPWQWETVWGLYDDLISLIWSVIPDVFTRKKTHSLCQGFVCVQPPINHQVCSWNGTHSQVREAAVSRLNTLRQFQGNNRLCQFESSGGGDSLVFLSGKTQRA